MYIMREELRWSNEIIKNPAYASDHGCVACELPIPTKCQYSNLPSNDSNINGATCCESNYATNHSPGYTYCYTHAYVYYPRANRFGNPGKP